MKNAIYIYIYINILPLSLTSPRAFFLKILFLRFDFIILEFNVIRVTHAYSTSTIVIALLMVDLKLELAETSKIKEVFFVLFFFFKKKDTRNWYFLSFYSI